MPSEQRIRNGSSFVLKGRGLARIDGSSSSSNRQTLEKLHTGEVETLEKLQAGDRLAACDREIAQK
jgi:hypothetical protein